MVAPDRPYDVSHVPCTFIGIATSPLLALHSRLGDASKILSDYVVVFALLVILLEHTRKITTV